MRPRLLHFKPNHRDEIVAILRSKVPPHVTMDPMALQLCARKIVAQAGDLRKANDFLSHASALSGGRVEIVHMANAISAATSSSRADKSPLPLHQQLVAITLLMLCRESSKKAFSLSKVGWERLTEPRLARSSFPCLSYSSIHRTSESVRIGSFGASPRANLSASLDWWKQGDCYAW